MIPPEVVQKIYDFIPSEYTVGDKPVEVTKFKAGEVINRPVYPHVAVGFVSCTAGFRGSYGPWESYRTETGDYEEIYGAAMTATVAVTVRAKSRLERDSIMTQLLTHVMANSDMYTLETDRLRFVEIAGGAYNTTEYDPAVSQNVFSATVDMRFEYLLTWTEQVGEFLRYDARVGSEDAALRDLHGEASDDESP
ncbi:MAG: hypothetical protein QHG98_07470 [Methanothrix sp.]|jgi:hypothetical protein|nr:hypothetical protein [Methanothrix sp.]